MEVKYRIELRLGVAAALPDRVGGGNPSFLYRGGPLAATCTNFDHKFHETWQVHT